MENNDKNILSCNDQECLSSEERKGKERKGKEIGNFREKVNYALRLALFVGGALLSLFAVFNPHSKVLSLSSDLRSQMLTALGDPEGNKEHSVVCSWIEPPSSLKCTEQVDPHIRNIRDFTVSIPPSRDRLLISNADANYRFRNLKCRLPQNTPDVNCKVGWRWPK